jgi:hypothetical protein
MANKDQPVGFEPYGKIESLREYVAGVTIYAGDLVRMANTGLLARCAAGEAALGVAMNYAAASGDKVRVCDAPSQQYKVQASSSQINAQTDIGLNFDIVVGSPNTTYKRSGMQLDSSTEGTTATIVLRLLAIDKTIDNALGDKVDCIVKINNHQAANNTVGL